MTLHINQVTKKFGSFTAVDDLSLTIPEQEIFGFLGANEWCWKTTTFRRALGPYKPYKRDYYMEGEAD